MVQLILLFGVALFVGWRRGHVDAKAVVGVFAVAIFLTALGLMNALALRPSFIGVSFIEVGVAFLFYVVPLLGGFLTGAAAKRQRLKNDTETDSAA